MVHVLQIWAQLFKIKYTVIEKGNMFSKILFTNHCHFLVEKSMKSHKGSSDFSSGNISLLDFICTVRLNKPLTNDFVKLLDPVVQSIVSLTSSLRGQLVKCFMTLSPNTLIFFAEKM